MESIEEMRCGVSIQAALGGIFHDGERILRPYQHALLFQFRQLIPHAVRILCDVTEVPLPLAVIVSNLAHSRLPRAITRASMLPSGHRVIGIVPMVPGPYRFAAA